jgi:hypothetical protein
MVVLEVVYSFVNWQKFRPQNTKVATYNYDQPGKSEAEFFADFSQKGSKVVKPF